MGGLAQMLPLINKKRNENKHSIVVDGGDFLNSYSYPDINRAVMEIYLRMDPDLVALGDQELTEGMAFLETNKDFFSRYLLASNANLPEVQRQKVFPVANLRILSWLDESAFDTAKKPSALTLSRTLFDYYYQQFKKNQLTIVIFHGAKSALRHFIKVYPAIDIILLAHAQSNIKQLKTRPFVIGGVVDGEYIKEIFISRAGENMQVNVTDIPVPMKIAPDTTVLKIIEKWQIK